MAKPENMKFNKTLQACSEKLSYSIFMKKCPLTPTQEKGFHSCLWEITMSTCYTVLSDEAGQGQSSVENHEVTPLVGGYLPTVGHL